MGFPMPVIVDCPSCGRQLRVPDSLIGKRVKCTGCETTFTAAGEGVPEAVPTRPAPRSREPLPDPEPEDNERWEEEDEDEERPRPRRRRRRRRTDSTAGYVLPPAICLLVLAVVGLLVDTVGVVFALTAPPPKVDPNAPELVRRFQQSSVGPGAAVAQGIFVVVNLVVILSAIQMMRRQSYGLAMTGAILGMLNIGNCCCLLSLPVGIWSVIVLCREDVKDSFD
jgi:predicted Zn finger-like uncharacterized protein